MPRQRRVAWMCPSRSTCCHGCWVSPNTLAVTPSSPTGTLSACVSVRHLVLYSRNTIQLTIQLYCSIHVSRIVTPSPRRHTAIQRHTVLYEHTAIQHHTAYTPYNTPQTLSHFLAGALVACFSNRSPMVGFAASVVQRGRSSAQRRQEAAPRSPVVALARPRVLSMPPPSRARVVLREAAACLEVAAAPCASGGFREGGRFCWFDAYSPLSSRQLGGAPPEAAAAGQRGAKLLHRGQEPEQV